MGSVRAARRAGMYAAVTVTMVDAPMVILTPISRRLRATLILQHAVEVHPAISSASRLRAADNSATSRSITSVRFTISRKETTLLTAMWGSIEREI